MRKKGGPGSEREGVPVLRVTDRAEDDVEELKKVVAELREDVSTWQVGLMAQKQAINNLEERLSKLEKAQPPQPSAAKEAETKFREAFRRSFARCECLTWAWAPEMGLRVKGHHPTCPQRPEQPEEEEQ